MMTMHRLKSIHNDESGVTLAELMVTVFLLTIVSIIFNQVLASSLTATSDYENAARANDEIRLVIARIDKELRSAEVICEPGPGMTSNRLHFFTRDGAGATTVVEEFVYELQDLDGDGLATDFVKSSDGGVTFNQVSTGVVNDAVAVTLGTPQPLFESQGANELSSSGTPQASPSFGRVMGVTIWFDVSDVDNIRPRVETTEIAGRNVWTPNSSSC